MKKMIIQNNDVNPERYNYKKKPKLDDKTSVNITPLDTER
jgi:hypothetical protein